MKKKNSSGYGLALLMVFLLTSALMATSTALVSGSLISQYTGQSSLNYSSAKSLAENALDLAQADMVNLLDTGAVITTNYRYPATGINQITMPSTPGSSSTVNKGSYYVSTTYARGFTYLLNATVDVGNTHISVPRLLQFTGRTSFSFNNALAIYSLRKVNPNYTGSAARVNCRGWDYDIGFDVNGNFDVADYRNRCLGDDINLLNVVTGARAAYALRRLRSTAIVAIKVRRTSGTPATQDIGFDSNGNLDLASLKEFVGTSSGYIDTWYDQSSSNYHLTQTDPLKQPRIINAGVLDGANGSISLWFDGNDSLSNNSVNGAISGDNFRSFLVAGIDPGTNPWGHFVTLYKTGDANCYDTTTSVELLAMGNSNSKVLLTSKNTAVKVDNLSQGQLYQFTSYHDSTGSLRLYKNGSLGSLDIRANNLSINSIVVGDSMGSDTNVNIKGYISEFILYTNNANQSKVETNQGHYYNIPGMQDGYVSRWFDQSGNSNDVFQLLNLNKPIIDVTGIRPAVLFDKTRTSLLESGLLSISRSPALLTAFAVGQVINRTGGTDNDHQNGQLLSVYKLLTSTDKHPDSEAIILQTDKTIGNMKDSDLVQTPTNSLTFNQDFQTTVVTDGLNRTIRNYQSSSGSVMNNTTNVSNQGIIVNNIRVGANDSLAATSMWDGRINEVILLDRVISDKNYLSGEKKLRTYYGL